MRLRRRRSAPLAAVLLAGCAIDQPAFPVQRFLTGDVETMRSFASQEAVDGPGENLALVLNVAAQCDLMQERLDAARQGFERAAQIMTTWATSGGEATAAIVGSESSKTYKGDPYEKAMNAFYLAYCYLRQGQPDNARAALKRGILADAEVADESYQADNALLFWMAGRMSTLMGVSDAAQYYREAQDAHEFALQHGARGDSPNPVLSDPEAGNLVLLFDIGLAPEKYSAGEEDELARFRSRPSAVTRARATLAGRPLGVSTILVDVDYQARTLGGVEMEGIRRGKAVFRSVSRLAGIVLLDQAARSRDRDRARTEAIVGGGLLLLSLLTSTAADVRYWPTLPSSVHVLTAQVPPGEHELVVDFLDASGRPLPGLRQQRRITVAERGESWFLLHGIGGSPSSANWPPRLRPATR
ncbi:MAG: hypothetical protein K8J09_08975 [Planctomycetes bacterium]|nr:hypothetical protein [Planctomycetota bacterium]